MRRIRNEANCVAPHPVARFRASDVATRGRLDRIIKSSKTTARSRLSASGGSRPWSQRNMPLTTTEVPTFFGPSDSPLFGVVHLPVDNHIRGGVVICGSLGKEGMDSVRLHRILADSLARRGFGVLRFDYLGLGDSAYAQGRDDAVPDWVASVGHALDSPT